MSDHRVQECKCPYCRYVIDAAGGLGGNLVSPDPGDFSVCLACGGIVRFTNNLSVRKATLEEATPNWALVSKILKIRAGIQHLKATRPDWPKGRRP